MRTKAQQRKERKRAARRRKLRKERNVRRNNRADLRFRLEVLAGRNHKNPEGEWRIVKQWRSEDGVRKHLRETEDARHRGDTRIIEGRIIDIKSGTEVHHIQPFTPEKDQGPTMREAAHDSMEAHEAAEVDKSDCDIAGYDGPRDVARSESDDVSRAFLPDGV